MSGEKDLAKLLKTLKPVHVPGDYVFCTVPSVESLDIHEIVCYCKAAEGLSIVVTKQYADKRRLLYSSLMSWITLTVHSSLDAVGMTAAFSKALSEKGISCNVVAAFHHDHIFVGKLDVLKAIEALHGLSDQEIPSN
ncbi:ACT domain-containing protein [soil metagenome]